MVRAIAMPLKDQVPEGPHRDFLVILFQMYRKAGRPPLKQIVSTAEQMNLDGAASQETVRRTLHGKIIPERWETAYAIYAPLCRLADIDPDAEYYMDGRDYDYEPPKSTHKELFRQVWSAAFDTEELPPPVLTVKVEPPRPASDPWANADEPPF